MTSVVFEDSDLVESLAAFLNRTEPDAAAAGKSRTFAMVERACEPFNAGDAIIVMPLSSANSPDARLHACIIGNDGCVSVLTLRSGNPALERTIVRPLRKGERMVVYP